MVSENIIENTCSQSGLLWCKFARVYSGAALLRKMTTVYILPNCTSNLFSSKMARQLFKTVCTIDFGLLKVMRYKYLGIKHQGPIRYCHEFCACSSVRSVSV